MLKVTIIGAGAIAAAHVEGFLKFKERVSITSVVNRTMERAQKLIDRYELNARAVSNYREVLDKTDIAVICTPPESHLEIALAAFAAGAHVLLEKPMAPTLTECDAILEGAKKSGKILSVIAQSRFINSINHVFTLMKSGDYGKILFAQVNSLWWRGPCYYDLAWRGRWETEGGGCTLNHAVHHIDLLLWAKGLPSRVTAVMGNLAHDNSEEEDISLALLLYPDGTLGQVNSSVIHHGEPQLLNFQLEQVGVSLPFAVAANIQRANGFPVQNEETEKRFLAAYEALPDLAHEHHAGQIGDFLKAVETGTQPLVTGESGRDALELITAIYKSASTGQSVELPLKKEDPFRTKEGLLSHAPRFNQKKRSVAAFEDMEITSFKGKY